MTIIDHCPICGGKKFSQTATSIDYTVSQETFNIIACTNCDFTLTSPRPDLSMLGEYYLSENYISHSNKAATFLDRIYLLARKFTLRWKVKILKTYYPAEKNIHVLDYGCGTGEFLKSCKEAGFDIYGVEPSQTAREKSSDTNSITIHKSIDDLGQTKFSIITMWHVLEHVPDFQEILLKLKSQLTDDGILIIAVPNHKSFDALVYKQKWAGYDVPRHLWHFSSDTMKRLLNNIDFKLVDIMGMKLDAYYVSLVSEKYKAANRSTLTGYINAFVNGMKSNQKARRTGEYSSLIYIVKK